MWLVRRGACVAGGGRGGTESAGDMLEQGCERGVERKGAGEVIEQGCSVCERCCTVYGR